MTADTSRIANLEAKVADTAAFLDELRAALAGHDSAFRDLRLAELEHKIGPSLSAPSIPSAPGTSSPAPSMGGLGSAYSPSVALGGAGMSITDGALSVSNGSSVVIIDGSSNMFKIAASGTQSLAFPAGVNTSAFASVTLTALGNGYTIPPAVLWMNTFSGESERGMGELLVPNGTTDAVGAKIDPTVSVATGYVRMKLAALNYSLDYTGVTAEVRYHVLKEAGI